MSASSERGKDFELKVRNITKRLLKIELGRDPQSGAGIRKADIKPRYLNELPLFIECKDHETVKPKEWWRKADQQSSYGQAPVVVFPDNEEVLCVMRYSDLLNFVKEAADYRAKADAAAMNKPKFRRVSHTNPSGRTIWTTEPTEQHSENIGTDPEGHLVPCPHIKNEFGKCMFKGCRNSSTYRPPKPKTALSKRK